MASIFISHSSRDKGVARKLASDLKHRGHDVWLDEWKIKVGQCIPTEIERGIKEADFVVLLLSPHAVRSNWVDREWKMAYWNEVNANSIVVLPVLLEECEIPELIQTKKYASFSKSYAIGFHELVSAIDSYEWRRQRGIVVPTRFASHRVLHLTSKSRLLHWTALVPPIEKPLLKP